MKVFPFSTHSGGTSVSELGTPQLYADTVILLSRRETAFGFLELAHCTDFSYTRWNKNKRHLITGMGATANARTTPCTQVFKSTALIIALATDQGPSWPKETPFYLILKMWF